MGKRTALWCVPLPTAVAAPREGKTSSARCRCRVGATDSTPVARLEQLPRGLRLFNGRHVVVIHHNIVLLLRVQVLTGRSAGIVRLLRWRAYHSHGARIVGALAVQLNISQSITCWWRVTAAVDARDNCLSLKRWRVVRLHFCELSLGEVRQTN